MRPTLTAALLVSLGLLCGAGTSQDPEQDPESEVNWRTRPDLKAKHYQEAIQGAWKLLSASRGAELFQRGQGTGYALFTEGHMALELHVRSEVNDALYFQTGIHRYAFDSSARLQTRSLIGTTSITVDDRPQFEPPGQTREFYVTLDGDSLELRHTDGTGRLLFQRVKGGGLGGESGVDFYGRPLKEADEDTGRRRKR